jgi:2-methylcitrate dehydratase PrpD
MTITETLSEFIANIPLSHLPRPAIEAARLAFIDTIGVALAGATEPCAQKVAALIPSTDDGMSLWGRGRTSYTPGAAFLNGVAAHALDYDDVQLSMKGHPSAPIIPALFAIAESIGSSGEELLGAYVVADEIAGRLGIAIGPRHYTAGWHNTSTLGTLAAAAGCARLLGLSAVRTAFALGIAASAAAGLKQNFGTMTKPLHAGMAARAGVEAALLAASGFTADSNIFDGPIGFLSVYSAGGQVHPEELTSGLGQRWQILDPGIRIKIYPCCTETHRALDATLALLKEHQFQPDDVERVDVLTTPTGNPLIHVAPRTGLEAKFSMEYCIAAAIVDGRIGLDTFTDASVARPGVRAVMERVRRVWDPSLPSGGGLQDDLGSETDIPVVTIYLRDGRVIGRRIEEPRGDPKNPVPWAEVVGKFRDCAGRSIPPYRVEQALNLLNNFDSMKDIRELGDILTGR